ncbi:MAG: hypothetical protein R2818_10660 [Flavobacteriales bacterium]
MLLTELRAAVLAKLLPPGSVLASFSMKVQYQQAEDLPSSFLASWRALTVGPMRYSPADSCCANGPYRDQLMFGSFTASLK